VRVARGHQSATSEHIKKKKCKRTIESQVADVLEDLINQVAKENSLFTN